MPLTNHGQLPSIQLTFNRTRPHIILTPDSTLPHFVLRCPRNHARASVAPVTNLTIHNALTTQKHLQVGMIRPTLFSFLRCFALHHHVFTVQLD